MFPTEMVPSREGPALLIRFFGTLSQIPEHLFFWGGGFLGGYIPLHGAMQAWLGETVKGRGSESEGAALEGFCLDWSVWAESCLLSCLAELLHCFAGSLLNGDENHPCL